MPPDGIELRLHANIVQSQYKYQLKTSHGAKVTHTTESIIRIGNPTSLF